MSDEPYRVGKNKPPLHTRFKKGQPSANPRGARKAGPIDVVAFFEQPLSVTLDGRVKKLPPLEATALSLLNSVAQKKDMKAAAQLIKYWAEAGLIVDRNVEFGDCGGFRLPSSSSLEAWWAKFEELGPPPWLGRKNGLCNDNWREEAMYEDD